MDPLLKEIILNKKIQSMIGKSRYFFLYCLFVWYYCVEFFLIKSTKRVKKSKRMVENDDENLEEIFFLDEGEVGQLVDRKKGELDDILRALEKQAKFN